MNHFWFTEFCSFPYLWYFFLWVAEVVYLFDCPTSPSPSQLLVTTTSHLLVFIYRPSLFVSGDHKTSGLRPAACETHCKRCKERQLICHAKSLQLQSLANVDLSVVHAWHQHVHAAISPCRPACSLRGAIGVVKHALHIGAACSCYTCLTCVARLCVWHIDESCRNRWTDRGAVWGIRVGPMKHVSNEGWTLSPPKIRCYQRHPP